MLLMLSGGSEDSYEGQLRHVVVKECFNLALQYKYQTTRESNRRNAFSENVALRNLSKT